jgi:sugar phosphate isomerase/epimerase
MDHARICVSSWSFHTLFEAPARSMDALDFPEMIADRFHVHNLEIIHPHFASAEPTYLRDFQDRLKKAQSRLVNIPMDFDELWGHPALSSTIAAERERAISLYKQGIDLAAALRCPMARCDPGIVNLDDPSITIDAYRILTDYGKAKGVEIVVENHGGIAQHPDVLLRLLQATGAGALPDIGNFPNEETRERALRLLFPLAYGVCHAKLGAGFDLAKYVRMANALGFHGVYSIEAGGPGDPYQAVQEMLDVLLQAD